MTAPNDYLSPITIQLKDQVVTGRFELLHNYFAY